VQAETLEQLVKSRRRPTASSQGTR
jgi:hypothetical protein